MKGWRTIIFSGLVSLLGLIQATDLVTLFNDKRIAGWVMLGIGAISIWLRTITTTPIGKS